MKVATRPGRMGNAPAGFALLPALLQAVAGCSLMGVTGPPKGPQPNPPPPLRCTTNKFAPILDGVLVSVTVVETGVQIAVDQGHETTPIPGVPASPDGGLPAPAGPLPPLVPQKADPE